MDDPIYMTREELMLKNLHVFTDTGYPHPGYQTQVNFNKTKALHEAGIKVWKDKVKVLEERIAELERTIADMEITNSPTMLI